MLIVCYRHNQCVTDDVVAKRLNVFADLKFLRQLPFERTVDSLPILSHPEHMYNYVYIAQLR